MSNTDYLRLTTNITHWNEDAGGENLKYSLVDFYKWAFLEVGAYQNITVNPNTSGVLGGDRTRLGWQHDPRFTDGRVWQGSREDWVWETGVSFSPQPTGVSVYVNSTLQSTSGYYVDYPHGRVVFNTPIATGSVVRAEFSQRSVSFVDADEPWFRELMFDSYSIQSDEFLNSRSGGNWSTLQEVRRQMPLVGVEVVGTQRMRPYQIGNHSQYQYYKVIYHIFAENASDRNKLRQIFTDMNDRVIWTYDRQLMKQDPRWPMFLDSRGTPVSGFLTFPALVGEGSPFRYSNVKFENTTSTNVDVKNGFLWAAQVSTWVEMINPYA